MSNDSCSASFCNNTRYMVKKWKADIIFHSFPFSRDVCRHWIKFCQREENWQPPAKSVICSAHFKPEDYQMANAPLDGSRRILRKLQVDAIPTIVNTVVTRDRKPKQETNPHKITNVHNEPMYTEYDHETEPTMLEYRDKFCRACLNHYDDGSLIPIESQIQDMTVLDMIIELTSFETEHSDAYPTVICLQCRDKLEEAYNVRTEIIVQAELLMALVAEQQLGNYFKWQLIEAGVSPDLTASMKPSEALEPMELPDHIESLESADPSQLAAKEHLDESVSIDINDHSGYTKALNQYMDSITEEDHALSVEEGISQNVDSSNIRDMFLARESRLSSGEDYKPMKTKTPKKRKVRPGRKKRNKMARSKDNEPQLSFPLTTCYICDTQHDNIVDRDLHMREHIPMLPYQCSECCNASDENEKEEEETRPIHRPPILKTTTQLNRHFMMHKKPVKCDKCYRRFCTSLQLKTHLWDCHGPLSKGLTCEYCGKQFFKRSLFRSHVLYHRLGQSGQIKCPICDRSFGSKDSLRRHESSHTGERKFKCLHCDKRFSTSYNRLTHQRLHTGELTAKCLECGKRFVDASRLRFHQARQHNRWSFQKYRTKGKPVLLTGQNSHCPYPGCDYTARTYTAMYVHRRSKHNATHKCEVCNKSFAFMNLLKSHMMLHTGEKPYQCEQCERRFRLILHYRKHMQTHRPDSVYACTVCSKSFKLPIYLRAHMLTHSSDRKFSCEICSNRFKTKGELTKHRRQRHSSEIKTDTKTDGASVEDALVNASQVLLLTAKPCK